jgi:hypothetical protein
VLAVPIALGADPLVLSRALLRGTLALVATGHAVSLLRPLRPLAATLVLIGAGSFVMVGVRDQVGLWARFDRGNIGASASWRADADRGKEWSLVRVARSDCAVALPTQSGVDDVYDSADPNSLRKLDEERRAGRCVLLVADRGVSSFRRTSRAAAPRSVLWVLRGS